MGQFGKPLGDRIRSQIHVVFFELVSTLLGNNPNHRQDSVCKDIYLPLFIKVKILKQYKCQKVGEVIKETMVQSLDGHSNGYLGICFYMKSIFDFAVV